MNTYQPSPIPTSHVTLPSNLEDLVETLAEHNHDHWALRRIEEGWTHGAERDDDAKTHPGLVPYRHLAESEKEYDRASVIETVRAMVALGYQIGPPSDGEGSDSVD